MLRLFVTLFVCFTFSATASHATTLRQVHIEDQWGKANPVTEQTQWIIFSQHKTGGTWVQNAFVKLDITPLDQHNLIYVADISAMPGLISRMFALPKMRGYTFRVALVQDEELVENWPKKENHVTVMQLHSLEIKQLHHFANATSLEHFLSEQLVPR